MCMLAKRLATTVLRPPSTMSQCLLWSLLGLSIGLWQAPLVVLTPAYAQIPPGAVLIDEDPYKPKGVRHEGTVCWRTDRIQIAGQPDEIVVHADVEIPDIRMSMTMDFRRNGDRSLPSASHTVEMKFVLPKDDARGEVFNVPGIMMKFSEPARGEPLAALSAKVTTGTFRVGLSNVAAERARNLRFLSERAWFDIPLVYADRRRGILAIGKGVRGELAFRDAMLAWEPSGQGSQEAIATPCSPVAGTARHLAVVEQARFRVR
jgi:hypothetical protein